MVYPEVYPILILGFSLLGMSSTTIRDMTEAKKRRDHSVLEVVGGFLALFVGFTMVLVSDGGSVAGTVGLLLIVVGVVLLILGFIQYGRNARAVASIVMGAAVKVNNLQTDPRSVADEVGRLTAMHNAGTLSDDEFAAAKAKALSN